MHLLSTVTGRLKWFDGLPPAYAILSHVWGKNEYSFQDVSALARGPRIDDFPDDLKGVAVASVGSSRLNPFLSEKIHGACVYARKLGFLWIWIDTCCIDKTSSAELSEAINSMFKWYSDAELCIAYLEDVEDPSETSIDSPFEDAPIDSSSFGGRSSSAEHPEDVTDPGDLHGHLRPFELSKWFERGWTLQELVAPRAVEFLSRGWKKIGTKMALAEKLESITGIDAAVLRSRRKLSDVPVAVRMRWASKRTTTRQEDRAYSLLGIFSISMPTLYGEGETAFQRLQERIMTSSPDQTLFLWGEPYSGEDSWGSGRPLLARSPAWFETLCCTAPEPIPLSEIPDATEAFCCFAEPCRCKQRCSKEMQLSRQFSQNGQFVRAWVPLIRAFGARLHGSLPFKKSCRRLSPDTPSFTKGSHGIRARMPLIRAVDNNGSALAILAVTFKDWPWFRYDKRYVALHLARISTSSILPHYSIRGVVTSHSWGKWPKLSKLSVEWADIYISEDAQSTFAMRLLRGVTIDLRIPSWVITKNARMGFFVSTESPDKPKLISRSDYNTSVFTLTSTHFDTPRSTPETLQLRFDQRRDARPFIFVHAVIINGQSAHRHGDSKPMYDYGGDGDVAYQPIPLGTQVEFGDGYRTVTLAYMRGPDDETMDLDIELSGRVYERHQQEYRKSVPEEDSPRGSVDTIRPDSPDSLSREEWAVDARIGEQAQSIDAGMAALQTAIAASKVQIARQEAALERLQGERVDKPPPSGVETLKSRELEDN